MAGVGRTALGESTADCVASEVYNEKKLLRDRRDDGRMPNMAHKVSNDDSSFFIRRASKLLHQPFTSVNNMIKQF